MPTHHRNCPFCEALCGVKVEVEGGRVRSVRGDPDDPFSRGHVCPKAVALRDMHEDPDRLRRPLRRTPGGDFEETSWDDAIAEAADRIHALQTVHGRNAMATYVGNPAAHDLGAMIFGPPFQRTLGTRNRFSATSVDQLPHMLAAYLMLGHQLLLPIPDVDRTDLLLMLGANPLASNGSLMTAPGIRDRLRALVDRGGELVVVDPRRTETARVATRYLPIRPGTDALLLFALLHVALDRLGGRPRFHHLAGRVRGADALAELAIRFPPERVASATGLDAGEVRALGEALVDAETAVVYGRVGTCTQAFGGLCQWLTLALNAVTGRLDRVGGAMFTTPAIDLVGQKLAGRGGFGRWRTSVRGLPEFAGELPVAALAEEILDADDGQRIRGLLTLAGNPVLSTPDGRRVDEALARLELLVCVDPYVNETTRHAHLILPPVGPLEKTQYDLIFHALAVRNTAKLSDPVFDPGPDRRDDGQILAALRIALEERRGGRLSRGALEARAMRAAGPARLVDLLLRRGPYGAGFRPGRRGLTGPRLRAEVHGVDLGPLVPHLLERLPGGRDVDLAPAAFVGDVPRLEATWLGAGAPGVGGELVLIGRRHVRSNNSWMHNVPHLVRGRDRCTLLVHPADAARHRLTDGAPVRVRSRVGEVVVPAQVTEDVREGVVSLPHGYGHDRPGVRLRVAREHAGASLNDLTDAGALDALSGNAVLSGVPVTVAPA